MLYEMQNIKYMFSLVYVQIQKLSYRRDSARRLSHLPFRDKRRTNGMVVIVASNTVKKCNTVCGENLIGHLRSRDKDGGHTTKSAI